MKKNTILTASITSAFVFTSVSTPINSFAKDNNSEVSKTTQAKKDSKIKKNTKEKVKVLSVQNGSTFKFSKGGKTYKAKLHNIDSPPKSTGSNEPYNKAKKKLKKTLQTAKKVEVYYSENGNKKDKNGYVHVYLYADGVDVGADLIKNGYVKTINKTKPSKFKYSKYLQLEKKAKNKKLGIWSLTNYIVNNEFRKEFFDVIDNKTPGGVPIETGGGKTEQEGNKEHEELKLDVNPKDYISSPEAFNFYLIKNKQKDENLKVEINTDYDMVQFVQKLYKDLPTKVEITSKMFSAEELYYSYDKATNLFNDGTPVKGGVTNYYAHEVGKTLLIEDRTNIQYKNQNFNVKTIKLAADEMSKDLAEHIKGSTEKESILNYYDYIYNNFKYNAQGRSKMLVGNFANGEMACNGFSYMTKLVFDNLEMPTQTRMGYSHYWNIITLSTGEKVTFDITTDIVLDKYKATLGKNTQEHIDISKEINFFNADFPSGKYEYVKDVSFD